MTNEKRGETACCAVDGRFANWIPGFELAFGAARPHSARATGYCGAAIDLFLAYPRGFEKIQSLQYLREEDTATNEVDLNITSATEFNAGDGFIIDPLLLLLPAFVAAAPLLVEICAATKEAAEIKNAVLLENAAIGTLIAVPASDSNTHSPRSGALLQCRRRIAPFIALIPLVTAHVACSFHSDAAIEMSQDKLINDLVAEGVIRDADVETALRAIDRGAFCPKNLPKGYVYQDLPLPIGYGETISAPHMHATCLELLRGYLRPGSRVLDVGSGSGYLSAAMGIMVRPNGRVIGIEKHPELAEYSIQRLREYMPEMLESGLVKLSVGNVLGDALENEEPFDAIHVGAAAATLPHNLVQKLKPGGRMVIPVGPQWDFQVLQIVDKDLHGKVKKHNVTGVRYVPLTKPGEE